MMESIARTSGDLDTLIAIKSRNLAYPYNFLEVAELHRESGRPDEALEWAERGLNSFSDRPDPASSNLSPTPIMSGDDTIKPWRSSGPASPTTPTSRLTET
jgi:hypothetical protein